MRFDGAATFDANGDLHVARLVGSVFRHSAPVSYQERDGVRTFVKSRFRLRGNGAVGFEIGGGGRAVRPSPASPGGTFPWG
ncbi:MAG: hypothetical protein R2762_04710 [Bryobacteraceae bacterium]